MNSSSNSKEHSPIPRDSNMFLKMLILPSFSCDSNHDKCLFKASFIIAHLLSIRPRQFTMLRAHVASNSAVRFEHNYNPTHSYLLSQPALNIAYSYSMASTLDWVVIERECTPCLACMLRSFVNSAWCRYAESTRTCNKRTSHMTSV